MKIKGLRRHLFHATLILTLSLSISSSAQIDSSTQNEPITYVNARADKIGWVYKQENGKYYRRLYNFTTQKYIGDWELVK